jgi:preprotein translocase subunit SecE
MAKTNPLEFLQEVRAETKKVTWPTRRETVITTVMVFIMVALAMVFFFLADTALSYIVSLVLGFGDN